jgi:putative inorganic carbon (HCO3(-)) transporter
MEKIKPEDFKVEDFYFLKIKTLWQFFWSEHPAFWCICGYLFIEYFRPQSIYPAIDILPWAQLFLIFSLMLSFIDKKSKLNWTITHTWLVLFSLQIYLSFVFAYDTEISKNQHIHFTQWLIVFFLITSIVTTRERFYVILIVFFICSLKLSIGTAKIWAMRGFAFTNYGINGPQGYFQNSGELAIQMLVLVALSAYLLSYMWKNSGWVEKVILLLSVLTPILTIIGASSRGSQLALAAIIILFFNKNIFRPKVLVVFMLMVIAINQFLPDEQKDRFRSMGGDNTSTQRILYWKNGWEMMKDFPLTGVGFFNFPRYFADYYPQDVNFTNNKGQKVAELPHNILIQVGTDAGFPALLFYLMILISVLKQKTLKGYDLVVKKGLVLGLIGFFIAGQFVSVAYYPFMWVSVGLLASLNVIYLNKQCAEKINFSG